MGRIPAAVFVSPQEETNRIVGGRVGEPNDNVPSGSPSDRASLVAQASYPPLMYLAHIPQRGEGQWQWQYEGAIDIAIDM